MALFQSLYEKMLTLAQHKHASRYLAGISFVESSVFPLPPDIVLIPMVMARADKAWKYAYITTIASVLGGVLGYVLGMFFIDIIEPLLIQLHYWDSYQRVSEWVSERSFVFFVLVALMPVPFKLFTLSAGALHIHFGLFLVASFVGRFCRFYCVSGLVLWKGAWLHKHLQRNIEVFGWGGFAVFALYALMTYLRS